MILGFQSINAQHLTRTSLMDNQVRVYGYAVL